MATITNSAFTASEQVLEQNIDMVLVLSSELVCQIAEKYFNQTMLKKKVKVIDLQPTSNGLVQFNVAFVVDVTPTTVPLTVDVYAGAPGPTIPVKLDTYQREANGKFRKVKDHE